MVKIWIPGRKRTKNKSLPKQQATLIELLLQSFKDATGNGISQTTINSITINNVDKPNEGWYTCQAVNKHGFVRHDAYLHVKDLCEGSVCTGEKVSNCYYGDG